VTNESRQIWKCVNKNGASSPSPWEKCGFQLARRWRRTNQWAAMKMRRREKLVELRNQVPWKQGRYAPPEQQGGKSPSSTHIKRWGKCTGKMSCRQRSSNSRVTPDERRGQLERTDAMRIMNIRQGKDEKRRPRPGGPLAVPAGRLSQALQTRELTSRTKT